MGVHLASIWEIMSTYGSSSGGVNYSCEQSLTLISANKTNKTFTASLNRAGASLSRIASSIRTGVVA